MASLDNLPKELYDNITSNFNTANDLATFGSVCRETQAFTKLRGWEDFVRRQFPGYHVPIHDAFPWHKVADRLTYLDRCWSKRAFCATVFAESSKRNKEHTTSPNLLSPTTGYSLVVSAGLLSSSLDELLVAGAGDDVVTRQSPDLGRVPGTWRKLLGRSEGYTAGDGDVTSLSIVDRHKLPEIVIGRANGDTRLRSLDEQGFRSHSRKLLPWLEGQDESNVTLPTRSFAWKVITSSDWQRDSQMLVTTQGPYLRLYNLAGEETDCSDLNPVSLYDVSHETGSIAPHIRTSKFINADTVVFGMSNADQPLRWGSIRPEGFELLPGANVPFVARTSSDVSDRPVTTVRAVETVKAFGPDVVLSAWEDGTIRLGDLRTPSHTDAVYRDRFHVHQISSSLLTYGASRFVAGDNSYPNLRIFDFRKNGSCYQHTDALACSTQNPSPRYKYGFVDTRRNSNSHLAAACNYFTGKVCNWHHQSRQRRWKPDATIYISNQGRVGSLAKASDVSTSFYGGVDKWLLEMSPQLTEDNKDHTVSRKAPQDWTARREPELAIIETGIGLCGTKEYKHADLGVPRLMRTDTRVPKMLKGKHSEKHTDKRFRLDVSYKPVGMNEEESKEWTSKWYKGNLNPNAGTKTKGDGYKNANKNKKKHRRKGSVASTQEQTTHRPDGQHGTGSQHE